MVSCQRCGVGGRLWSGPFLRGAAVRVETGNDALVIHLCSGCRERLFNWLNGEQNGYGMVH